MFSASIRFISKTFDSLYNSSRPALAASPHFISALSFLPFSHTFQELVSWAKGPAPQGQNTSLVLSDTFSLMARMLMAQVLLVSEYRKGQGSSPWFLSSSLPHFGQHLADRLHRVIQVSIIFISLFCTITSCSLLFLQTQ